jgi:hypothetical protein
VTLVCGLPKSRPTRNPLSLLALMIGQLVDRKTFRDVIQRTYQCVAAPYLWCSAVPRGADKKEPRDDPDFRYWMCGECDSNHPGNGRNSMHVSAVPAETGACDSAWLEVPQAQFNGKKRSALDATDV